MASAHQPPFPFFEQPTRNLADRYRLGLACRAHQARWNVELPGRAKSPGRGEGLTGQASHRLLAQIDTLRVMGAASQDRVSVFHREASDIDTHIEKRAALRLNQRPFFAFFMRQKQHKFGFHTRCDVKGGFAI